MPHQLSHAEYQSLFVPPDSINRDEHVIVHYRLQVPTGAKVEDVAATLAVLISVGTTQPMPGETMTSRAQTLARILATGKAGNASQATIAIPLRLIGATTSVAELLTTLWFPAEYSFVDALTVQELELPKALVSSHPGPRIGIDGIRAALGIFDRPLLGAILKPRAGVDATALATTAYEVLRGGADYVIDDELIVDPSGPAAFETRAIAIVAAKKRAAADTKSHKWYIANIGGTPHRTAILARRGQHLGVDGVLLNAFTVGFSTVEDLSRMQDLGLPVFTSNMGTAMLTRHDTSGTAEGVIAKLSRLAGADGAYTGILRSGWYSEDVIQASLAALRAPFHGLRAAFPVVAGGLTIANLYDNIVAHWPDVMLQAGTGMIGFPGGPRKGAQVFRQLLDEFTPATPPEQAENALIELGRANTDIRAALQAAGFGQAGRKQ